ncbi:MAG: PilZ domain-containing protein [Myxococcales bacterium]
MHSRTSDRRSSSRNPLYLARRRYPRVKVRCDVFYESAERATFAKEAELSVRGMMVPCVVPDPVGARGKVRIDTGEGALVVAEVQVARLADGPRPGMVLRFVHLEELDRMRIGELLVRAGGLSVIPHLERRFPVLTRAHSRPAALIGRAVAG